MRIAAISLLIFNGLSAVYGGGSLVIDPSGEWLQLPIALLERTPFESFLIPGLILLSVNGVLNLVVAFLGIRKRSSFPAATTACGALLVIWLTVQIILIGQFYAPAHLTYGLVGVAMVFVGWRLRALSGKRGS